jgi:hypothetical protein
MTQLYQIYCDCAPDPILLEAASIAEPRNVATDMAMEHACPCHVKAASGEIVATVTPPHGADRGSPPSTYAVLAVMEGEEGAWGRVALATGVRALAILPGLWAVGLRGWKLPGWSLAASTSITLWLFALYSLKRHGVNPSTLLGPNRRP